jgi:hypothetical protein
MNEIAECLYLQKIVSLFSMDAESRVTVMRCVEELCLHPESSDRPVSEVFHFFKASCN